jgi:hypothetical protein
LAYPELEVERSHPLPRDGTDFNSTSLPLAELFNLWIR